MWVQKKRNGTYQFFERYCDKVTGKYRTVSVTLSRNTTAMRKIAMDLLREKIQKAQSVSGDHISLTLRNLTQLYLKRTGIQESTRKRDLALSHVLLKIFDPDTLVNMLSAGYIKEKLEEAGRKDNRELIARTQALLRWGYKNDYVLDISYLSKLEKKKKNQGDAKDRFLEDYELQALLDGMAVTEWRCLTEFLALSGLRIGEAIALRHSDIHKNIISVTKSYGLLTHSDGPTKTEAGVREVIITKALQRCISEITKRSAVSEYFLTGPNKKQVSYPAYRKYLAENSLRILGRKIRPHALRHTYTSLMAAAGIPLDVIARQLGHEDSSVTRSIYFHVTERLKEKDADMIRGVNLLSSSVKNALETG